MNRNLLIAFMTVVASCCFTVTLKSQNLVLNPSFENTSSCPQGISELYLATDWTSTNTGSDSCSSPDLYAACAPSIGGVNVPNALLGTHAARTGTHFAGIILGDGFPGCLQTGDNYREYIEGTLSTPLVAGQTYEVKFYMSLADGVMWGSNSVGVYFSNTQYLHNACTTGPLINLTPQLEMCGPAIMDTVNWIPVSWTYTATGGEQYFTIGNFKNDANTNRVTHNCSSFNAYIYYYIEDVSISTAGPNQCGVSVVTDSTNATCGAHDGSVAVTAFGCTTPFTYAWSTGATTASVQSLAQGSYTITVTDLNNCHTTASIAVNANLMTVGLAATNPTCGSTNGSATLAVTNGTGPYTYTWSNSSTSQTISNLSAGTYKVTATGAAGCSAVDSVSLLGASGLTITPAITAASCGSSNGSVTANITGGSAPYSYSWSNGQTTQIATNLAAGSYSVTVHGDTTSAPFWTENFISGGTGWTLNTPGAGSNGGTPNQWIVNNDNGCSCGSGNYLHITCNSASFACFGQTGTCTYLALPANVGFGDFTTDVLAISPVISTIGKSNITLTFSYESLGTPGTDYGVVNLSNNGGATWTALPTQYLNVSTCTAATVAIPINYQNTANFRIAFEWINATGSVGGNTGNPPGFVIDDVALTSAASNCPATTSVTVGSTAGITAAIASTTPSCGQNNGSATANVTLGTGPFTYVWNNGATTQTISNLGAGLYNVTISNGTGCSATSSTSFSVGSGNLSVVSTPTNANCGNNNGSVIANVSPANGNYTYSWSNGATTNSVSNLGAGTYSVTVTGAGGCTGTSSSTVSSSGGLSLSAFGGRAGCVSSGTASVSVTTGTGPFTYLWSNSATASSIGSLSAGNYSVTVTGAAGCSASTTVTVISTGTGVTLNAVATPTGCSSNTGTASVSESTGNGPYTYAWSNGGTTDTISNLASGSYVVTVTGSGGCSATASVSVSNSGGLVVSTSAIGTTCGSTNGSASVSATGGGQYTYSWNNGATSSSISNVAAGTYTVTVVASGGCSATASAIVNPSGSTVSIQANQTGICQGDTSQICAPAGFHSYHWNIGDTSQCISATAAGNYYVTVTDNGNCTATSNHISVAVNVPAAVTITLHGDTLKAAAAASYQWYLNGAPVSGATGSTYIATSVGNYYVRATDGNGCIATSNTELVKGILGINELNGNDIKVYPNPLSGGGWHLDVSNEWVGSICEVYDAAGRVIYKTEIKSTQSEIEMNVAQGIYLMRINSEQKNYTIKLIKL